MKNHFCQKASLLLRLLSIDSQKKTKFTFNVWRDARMQILFGVWTVRSYQICCRIQWINMMQGLHWESHVVSKILLIFFSKKISNMCRVFFYSKLSTKHGLRRCVRARTCAMCGRTCACACEMTSKICVRCACVRALLSWSHTTHVRKEYAEYIGHFFLEFFYIKTQ